MRAKCGRCRGRGRFHSWRPTLELGWSEDLRGCLRRHSWICACAAGDRVYDLEAGTPSVAAIKDEADAWCREDLVGVDSPPPLPPPSPGETPLVVQCDHCGFRRMTSRDKLVEWAKGEVA